MVSCRLCGSDDLVTVLDLGEQALTGVFPLPGETVERAPLELTWCRTCTLVQLRDSFEPSKMYGENYGYRSGLNQSMVDHLARKAHMLEDLAGVGPGDVVLDIGSNDGTLLGAYTSGPRRIGMDPTAAKFWSYYDRGVEYMEEFFSAERFLEVSGPARVITSIAMFYDLEDPVAFAKDVAACLAPYGVWHFEQSYMPAMLRQTAYDMVCHEHVEYYSLSTVQRILREADLEFVDVRLNSINGGSFAVTAAHWGSPLAGHRRPFVERRVAWEQKFGLPALRDFEVDVFQHRADLRALIQRLRVRGASVMGYGASTKGNVLLQFCDFDHYDITAIAEVNEDKFGRVTPGTNIPIIPEAEMRERHPDYLLVLPWHFRDGIVEREREYLRRGGKLIFPLPEIEIVGA